MTAPGSPRPASWSGAPFLLPPNQPPGRPYRGGAGIARFRELPWDGSDPFTPEDFLGSTTSIHGSDTIGVTVLEPGLTLRDAVASDPLGFLGPEHVERHGAETMLLVKLLDTAERLFVHLHPDDAFAAARLNEPRGKTEAWIIVAVEEGAEGAEGYAALGFTREVSSDEAARWFAEQDVDGMLAAMHRVALSPGDTLLVPAGLPHAIGPGITLVELQQPQDLSILLEYAGYGLSERDALIGLDPETALAALDRRAWSAQEVRALAAPARPVRPGVTAVFPAAADVFFRAERVTAPEAERLEPGFSVMVVTAGAGRLAHDGGELAVRAGDVALIPHGAGEIRLLGDFEAIRARPPV
jgi:mannose-6-phosphate isomerase